MLFVCWLKVLEFFVVLFEDVGVFMGLIFVLFGVGFIFIIGNLVFDVFGIVMIGVLLVLIVIVLGVEMKSLLVGEGVILVDYDCIVDVIMVGDEIEKIIYMKMFYFGLDEFMVVVKIVFNVDKLLCEVVDDIDVIEVRICEVVLVVCIVYIEFDIYWLVIDLEFLMDVFVLKFLD